MSAVHVFENIVDKGEIAQNKQFPLFPQCFEKFSANFIKFPNVVSELFGRVRNLLFGTASIISTHNRESKP